MLSITTVELELFQRKACIYYLFKGTTGEGLLHFQRYKEGANKYLKSYHPK